MSFEDYQRKLIVRRERVNWARNKQQKEDRQRKKLELLDDGNNTNLSDFDNEN